MMRDMVLVELMAVMGGKQREVMVMWMALMIIAMKVEVMVVVLGAGNGGNDRSDHGIGVGSGCAENVGSDDGFHSGVDAGVIMAKMVDFMMVRMVVLAMEAMMLDLTMTNTIL